MLASLNKFAVTVTSFSFEQAAPLTAFPEYYKTLNSFQDWFEQARQNPDTTYVITGSLYFIAEICHSFFIS